MTHAPVRRTRLIAALAIVVMAATGTILGQPTQAAWAAEYPSWADVQNARSNEAAKQAQITQIQGLLARLETQVSKANAVAEQKGAEFFDAQNAYDEAVYKADLLQAQADEAQASAEESMRKAGQLAARLQRAGSTDLSANLFFGEEDTVDLLSQLGMATKVGEQSEGIYTKAKQDQNTAQSLTNDANVAKAALQELAAVAEKAMQEAQAAADAAAAALAEQAANQERLQVQLASLIENRQVTEAEYAVGVEVRRQAEIARQAELARQAAANAAAAAAAAAAAGQSGPAGPAGVSAGGWTRPSSGYVSAGSYGYRVPPFPGASSFHAGADIGSGCYSPIYAASSGRITYAGPNGGYGNYVQVDHGGGVVTGYAHIVNGGIGVSVGQQVGVGQQIAQVGTTGSSNGCHLHFEVRVNGGSQNPVYYLRNKGVNW
ncbi:MAG: hypothetical protein JWP30_1312 [Homoserinimonas sp.]|jgi:murein DD-endopeptidase MepM/ murein hydrolase activator NlpD|nr:hypothetical protein [Homoserinimonas sp.]